jgi:protocatechuate 3,4-dioxygenase beta subunit
MISRRWFLKSAVLVPGMPKLLQEEELDLTETNIEGPYYLPEAPFRTTIHEGKGTAIVVSGVVKARNGRPIADALVDVWQADAEGTYHNEEGDDPKTYRFRGRIQANDKGEYAFETIRPGRYKLTATKFRPAHIHLKASAKGYRLLTTQIYFTDDDLNKSDPYYRPSLAVALSKEGDKLRATFPVVLARR